ncbi:MAG: hypothetical protein NZ954_07905 [Thermofilaceae archaeon]|nr:hypothetical protein [Thermofilaceae archaeon]MCX8179931.1 hypothetical protein [Thermofilaceae archaeon]MDW8004378.1 hypothetical protein [Thermofilaceae archaeon]
MVEKASYKLLLSDRVRELSVAEAFDYIDALQSYKGDWPLYLTPSAILETEKVSEVEGLTPIPATHGALAFIEFYVDEEAIASNLSSKLKVGSDALKSALERGVPLHRLVPQEAFGELENVGSFLKAVLFEATVPVERKLNDEEARAVSDLEWVVDFDTVEVEVPGVKPEVVEAELNQAYYVGDYLKRLEKLFSKAEVEAKHLLLVRGEEEAGVKLKEVEALLDKLVRKVTAVRVSVMYYRLLLPI